MLPVNEIFESIQGEATFTGTPSLFIRLQGCPVGCGWCDTKHTWELSGKIIPIADMTAKECDTDEYALMHHDELIKIIQQHKSRHVVLTGGEPCLHDLWMLCSSIHALGKTVQVETSGTYEVHVPTTTFVTVSPKQDMPGGLEVLQSALNRADEIKYPVGKQRDVEKLTALLDKVHHSPSIWLQPLSQSKSATALCVQAATDNGWRISIQTHKFIGVR